ncbi:MAG: hypothetical protein JO197_18350 [Acidobacteria bacterium]|nr:hypothetical protein [Acidobacteriota bacterium]MBV9479066.1 hypothetical protein [Acidobacteriota bacterium]
MTERQIGPDKPAAKQAATRLSSILRDADGNRWTLDDWKKVDAELEPIGETLGKSVKGGAFRDNALNVKHALLDLRRALADGNLRRVNELAKTAKLELGPVLDWVNR